MLIGAHISQVASSTPFLRCSRFSPIAFNLSNTKPSIQPLYVLDCPFRCPKPTRSYPTRSPLHFESSKAETQQSTPPSLASPIALCLEWKPTLAKQEVLPSRLPTLPRATLNPTNPLRPTFS